MVNDGMFREDLYFRLAVLKVQVPPLRERPEDVPALAAHFLPAGASLPPEVTRAIERRPWRGNVRELRNFVERLLAFGPEHALGLDERAEVHSTLAIRSPITPPARRWSRDSSASSWRIS